MGGRSVELDLIYSNAQRPCHPQEKYREGLDAKAVLESRRAKARRLQLAKKRSGSRHVRESQAM